MRHHVANGGATGRSNQPIRLGRSGSGFFRSSGEEAFGLEALLELLESELQGTEPDRFDILDIDLVFAT